MSTEHQKSVENLPQADTARRKPGTGRIMFPLPYYHRRSVLCKEIMAHAYNPFVQNLFCACTVLGIYSKYLCCAWIDHTRGELGSPFAPRFLFDYWGLILTLLESVTFGPLKCTSSLIDQLSRVEKHA